MNASRPFTSPNAEPQPAAPAPAGGSGIYVPDVVFILARDGRILYVNQTLGGVPPDAAAGSNLYDWIAPEQQAGLRDVLDGVFSHGEPRGLDLTRLPRHDPKAWYECRINATLRGGEVVSATLVARDITRHKLAGEELNRRHNEAVRRMEELRDELARAQTEMADLLASRDADGPLLHRFRSLLEAAGEAIFITDPGTGAVVDANGTACRWLRKSREDVLGKTAAQLGLEFTIQVPEGADLAFTETRDTRRPVMVSGGVQRRQDGSTFPVEVAVARHRFGEEEYLLAVVRDVKEREYGMSALRQREAAYSDLFEESWDGVYLTTRSGQIMAANPAAAVLLGYAREEMTSLDARTLFAKPVDIRRFQEAMAAYGVVRNLDVELRRKDGTVFRALLTATRRYGADGGIQGHQCLVRPRTAMPETAVQRPGPAGPPVLVFETEEPARRETVALLTQVGMPVLEAADLARATELLREHAGTMAAVIFGFAAGEKGADLTVEEFRHIDPEVPIIISSNEDRLALAERLADLNVAAFVDRPAHPLALVQRVREVGSRRGAA